jgi:maltose alpha-D-glucosyltransferase / alpha-amylase
VTSAYLDRFIEEQRLISVSERPGESEERNPYLRYMSQAGRRVAEMHLALASNGKLPDFAPEPARAADRRQMVEDVTTRAEHVFEVLKQRRNHLRESDRALVDAALAHRTMLHERLSTLLASDSGGLNIRLHGSFDLGRLLIVKDDIFITGFEGDPRLPLAERRRKGPAARDIAGLLRSIDYSVTVALERALRVAPDEHGKLAAKLTEWRDRSADAVLTGYRAIKGHQGLWPKNARVAAQVLDFFQLEKTFEETEYELLYRPEWLRVPLTGMLRILSQSINGAS